MVLPPVDESLLSQLADMGPWRFSFVFGSVWFGLACLSVTSGAKCLSQRVALWAAGEKHCAVSPSAAALRRPRPGRRRRPCVWRAPLGRLQNAPLPQGADEGRVEHRGRHQLARRGSSRDVTSHYITLYYIPYNRLARRGSSSDTRVARRVASASPRQGGRPSFPTQRHRIRAVGSLYERRRIVTAWLARRRSTTPTATSTMRSRSCRSARSVAVAAAAAAAAARPPSRSSASRPASSSDPSRRRR